MFCNQSQVIRLVAAQLEFRAGAIASNVEVILKAIRHARDHLHADLIVFPELALCGYLSEDYLLRTDFQQSIQQALTRICAQTTGIAVVLGYPDYTEQGIWNAASWIANQEILATYHKQCLPNRGVFDERRYFKPGTSPTLITFKGVRFALLICEDLWYSAPLSSAKDLGAECVLVLNASPFSENKPAIRYQILQQRILECSLPILSVHTVGAQDDLLFDGGSLAIDVGGVIQVQAQPLQKQLLALELEVGKEKKWVHQHLPYTLGLEAMLWQVLQLALQGYVDQHHFPSVLLGVSGGIDSAVVLALAVDTLGPNRVQAVLLPSRYTSDFSIRLAKDICKRLKVPLKTISIEPSFQTILRSLALNPEEPPSTKTIENIQARARGLLLMALANQTGALLLNTTNKSELAVGYGTLYGDLIGGFAPIKDVFKTRVYQLAIYRNSLQVDALFPEALLSRPPTAELQFNQRDEDTLPPYPQLDAILEHYIERDCSKTEIISAGFPERLVQRVLNWIDQSEFKRRQAPIGPCVSQKAFGRGRRYSLSPARLIEDKI